MYSAGREYRSVTMRRVPSLVDLCVQSAIKNIKYLGDVGDTDYHLLDRILSRCELKYMKRIEDSTKGRDLSPVTDKFWKKSYSDEFGVENTNIVVERMRLRKVTFKWRQLYEAKKIQWEQALQKSSDRFKQRRREEDAKKQSRQVKVLTDVPPIPAIKKQRRFWPGDDEDDTYNTKSIIMKKAKRDFFNCVEVKNIAAMRNKTVRRINR